MTPRLRDHYNKKIVVDLQTKFAMKNKLMVPKVVKVVLNMSLGNDAADKKIVQKVASTKTSFNNVPKESITIAL